MNRYALVTLVLFALTNCQRPSEEATQSGQLPVTIKQGYGPFYPSFGRLTPDDAAAPLWGKLILPTKGKPANWTGLTQTMVWLDSYQLFYQNVKAGTVSPADFLAFQR